MIGRKRKASQPAGGNPMQSARVKGVPARGLRMLLRNGKVFRKNAGFPWGRATMLG